MQEVVFEQSLERLALRSLSQQAPAQSNTIAKGFQPVAQWIVQSAVCEKEGHDQHIDFH